MKSLLELYNSLNDKPLHEIGGFHDPRMSGGSFDHIGEETKQGDKETLMVKLGGDEKTELKISNQTDSNGNINLDSVTLEFKGDKIENLYFTPHEMLEDHENEGQDWLFTAEDKGFASSYTRFEVEVNVQYGFEDSGMIDDVEWRSLETFPTEMDMSMDNMDEQQGCTEQEIAEGTCGYGIDGELGDEPAGPSLMRERFKKLANII